MTEHRSRLGLAFVCLLSILIYSLGFSGPFLFDDVQNIVLNPSIRIEDISSHWLIAAWKGNDSGPLGRPIASISFAFNFWFDGLNTFGYKLVNAVLHALCGIALFLFVRTLLRAAGAAGHITLSDTKSVETIALLTCSLWLLAPIHVSTVLYVVQRMTVLSALFSFLALAAYCQGRLCQLQGRPGWLYILLAMPTATLFAVLSKESGLLVPLLCACCEAFLLIWKAKRTGVQNALRGLYALTFVSGLTFIALFGETIWHTVLAGYIGRPFTMPERLLTEARMLFQYTAWILAPDIGQMNLYHDDVLVSKNWLHPISSAASVAAWVIGTLIAVTNARRWPLLGFSLFFFLIGHLLESSVIALELVFEHRNYLPAAGWFFLFAVAINHLSTTRPRIGLALVVTILLASSSLLAARCWQFADEFRLMKHSLQSHPNSMRTQLWAGDYYRVMKTQLPAEKGAPLEQLALAHYRKAAALDPTDTIGLSEVLLADAAAGRPPQAEVLAELDHRYATAPASAGTINGAFEFAREITDRKGQFPPQLAIRLLRTLADNPKLGDANRGTVLASVGSLYMFTSETDQALAAYRQAQNLRPEDPYLWISHSAAALHAGNLDEADTAARQARKYDAGELSEGLDLLEADIVNARNATNTGLAPSNFQ